MKDTKRIFILAGLLVGLISSPLTAGSTTSVLYWTDHTVGDDAMAGALNGLALSEDFDFQVTYATDDADFATKVASGNYDLGILFVQAMSQIEPEYASIGALATFVDNGGLAMYADWTRDNTRAAQFGFQFTGNTNESDLFITDDQLREPMEIDDALKLASPGWFDFSFGLSVAPEDGVVLAEYGNGDAAVVRTMHGGRVMGFGMLNDTFADSAVGEAFFTNALIAIPEPATYAGVLGAVVLGLILIRRRNSGCA